MKLKELAIIFLIFCVVFYLMLPVFGCGARLSDNIGFYYVETSGYRVTDLGIIEIACRR